VARPNSEKCRLCSKLNAEEAKQQHGPADDSCWDEQRCHNRRSYYRHRGVRNYNRKQQRYQQQNGQLATTSPANYQVVTLEIPVPATPAAIAHWYRETGSDMEVVVRLKFCLALHCSHE